MTRNTLLLFVLVIFFSCNRTEEKNDYYPEDISISNPDGVPHDSLVYYFPDSIKQGDEFIETGLDGFMQTWYSSALYAAKEPVLYNYYLGHDIYRFLWLRSFHRPVVFSLHKKKKEVWLTTKILDKQPEFLDMTYVVFTPPVVAGVKQKKSTTHEEKPDSVVKADRRADIVFNQTKILSVNEWNRFEVLLDSCLFWDMKPYKESFGLDGARWTIEGHFKDRYWFVSRWAPHGEFKAVGVYLIEKSGLEEEIY